MSAGKMTATNFRLSSAPAVIVTQRFTTADGAQLCYQLRGDEAAPRLLCVQGSMQDMRRAGAPRCTRASPSPSPQP